MIPVWASEIERVPISITRRHFPDMMHLGDIREIDGAKIKPVDVIAFGSPCQDLSIAGRKKGLAGERSGLFSEAVRIIYEMREATNGKYPAYAVWENVPGALSSNGRRDFAAVLAALAKTEIPTPASGRWANAGMVRGCGVDIAWRVLDARYWGIPQRRRRIFLVADFTGECAGEILFVEKGLRGNTETGGKAREGTAADPENRVICAGFNGHRSVTGSLEYAEDRAPCIGSTMPPNVVVGAFTWDMGAKAGNIGYDEKVTPTLKSNNANVPAVVFGESSFGTYKEQVSALKASGGALGGGSENFAVNCLNPWDAQSKRIYAPDGLAPTLSGSDGGGGRNPGGLVITETYPSITATLCASAAGLNRPAGQASEPDLCIVQNRAVRRLTPLECERLMGFPDEWTEYGISPEDYERYKKSIKRGIKRTGLSEDVVLQKISDTARYKALGNSVARPCAEFVLGGIAAEKC
jgi:DNA (cytosine-5)-methyltransferase 1